MINNNATAGDLINRNNESIPQQAEDDEHQQTTTTPSSPPSPSPPPTKNKTSITRFIIYFLIYSALFWTLYFIYQYKYNQEFKQKFVKWYLATFHNKKSPSSDSAGPTIPGEFKVDFVTYKQLLPYKSSGGNHAMDYFKFTQEELKHYNGKEDSKLPLLIAIKGRVYDVSEGASYYGPEGGYHFFAGRDGTRSFVTGCFDEEKEECTSVQSKYSDFDKEKMQSVDDWVKFYDNHEKYKFIGIVTDLKNT